MPEWLDAAIPTAGEIPTAMLFGKLLQSATIGVLVAAIYYLTQRKGRADAVPFVATLVLLTVLISMVTQVIGNNVARAFSLAGALAIIRFRTVVDDTRDTAFVIAAVVTGMAAGAGMLEVALAGLPVVAIVAVLLMVWGGVHIARPAKGVLTVKLAVGLDPNSVLTATFGKLLKETRMQTVETAKQGAVIEVKYQVILKPDVSPIALIADLTRVEGVQGVEWKDGLNGK